MAVPGFEDLSKAFGNPFAVSAFRQPYVCGQMLARGFTSVRDCGGATLALKEAIEDGVFPGPRLFISCHALSQTGGHGDIRVSFFYRSRKLIFLKIGEIGLANVYRDRIIILSAVVARMEI